MTLPKITNYTITAIVAPTTAWYATYEQADGDDELPSALPIAVWALLSDQRVVGFVAAPDGGALVPAETIPGEFLGYVDESELLGDDDPDDE